MANGPFTVSLAGLADPNVRGSYDPEAARVNLSFNPAMYGGLPSGTFNYLDVMEMISSNPSLARDFAKKARDAGLTRGRNASARNTAQERVSARSVDPLGPTAGRSPSPDYDSVFGDPFSTALTAADLETPFAFDNVPEGPVQVAFAERGPAETVDRPAGFTPQFASDPTNKADAFTSRMASRAVQATPIGGSMFGLPSASGSAMAKNVTGSPVGPTAVGDLAGKSDYGDFPEPPTSPASAFGGRQTGLMRGPGDMDPDMLDAFSNISSEARPFGSLGAGTNFGLSPNPAFDQMVGMTMPSSGPMSTPSYDLFGQSVPTAGFDPLESLAPRGDQVGMSSEPRTVVEAPVPTVDHPAASAPPAVGSPFAGPVDNTVGPGFGTKGSKALAAMGKALPAAGLLALGFGLPAAVPVLAGAAIKGMKPKHGMKALQPFQGKKKGKGLFGGLLGGGGGGMSFGGGGLPASGSVAHAMANAQGRGLAQAMMDPTDPFGTGFFD